jgi:hypothetical protein
MDCFVAIAPLRKRFAFVAGNDGVTHLAASLAPRHTHFQIPAERGMKCHAY